MSFYSLFHNLPKQEQNFKSFKNHYVWKYLLLRKRHTHLNDSNHYHMNWLRKSNTWAGQGHAQTFLIVNKKLVNRGRLFSYNTCYVHIHLSPWIPTKLEYKNSKKVLITKESLRNRCIHKKSNARKSVAWKHDTQQIRPNMVIYISWNSCMFAFVLTNGMFFNLALQLKNDLK